MLPPLQLEIDLGPGSVPEDYEATSQSLRDELLDLDVVSVACGAAAAPAGAKGPGGIDLGTLVITLSNSAVLVALVGVLKSWAGRARDRKVKLRLGDDEIEITGATRKDVDQLLESWAARHES